jgi:hypothetical protein
MERPFPFYPGEKLIFSVKWSHIPAGEAELEVLPIEKVKGVPSYHFRMRARTYPYIDLFYKVRDKIDGYTDLDMTHSILYKIKNRGRKERDIVVDFDWERNEVKYSKYGKKRKPVSVVPGSFDPLSVFYVFRLQDLEIDEELTVSVTDGKRCIMAKARVLRREEVRVASGTYDTFLVEPDLGSIGGIFEKRKDSSLQIWVTADERRIPVKVKSSVKVGSFVAELVSGQETPAVRKTDAFLDLNR